MMRLSFEGASEGKKSYYLSLFRRGRPVIFRSNAALLTFPVSFPVEQCDVA